MMLATVRALRALGGSATVQELDQKVAEIEGVSDLEQTFMMGNDRRPRFNYYLAWSRTYLKRGHAIENSARGVWALTDLGEAVDDLENMIAIHDQVNAEERERAKTKRKKGRDAAEARPEDEMDDSESDGQDWRLDLLSVLQAMDPSAFERLAQRVLREAGFVKVEVRGKSGDGGIDGVGVLRLNLVSFQIYFQCKRYKGSVGSKEIRDFRGALQGRADKGLFITTGTFTSSACEEAVLMGQSPST
jgi:restriction system protein